MTSWPGRNFRRLRPKTEHPPGSLDRGGGRWGRALRLHGGEVRSPHFLYDSGHATALGREGGDQGGGEEKSPSCRRGESVRFAGRGISG